MKEQSNNNISHVVHRELQLVIWLSQTTARKPLSTQNSEFLFDVQTKLRVKSRILKVLFAKNGQVALPLYISFYVILWLDMPSLKPNEGEII